MSFLLGLLAGFLLSIPPTGPIPLLVLRHLARRAYGRAVRVGLGSSLGDVPYAVLAVLGYGAFVADVPLATVLVDLVGVVALGVVAVTLWRTPVREEGGEPTAYGGDVLTGFVVNTVNPSGVLTWAIAASVLGSVQRGRAGALAWGLGIGLGETAWWILLAALWRRFGPRGERLRTWLLRGSAVLAVGLAAWLAVHAGRVLARTLGGAP